MTASPRTVTVGGDTPYTIHIGPGLLGQGELLTRHVRGRHVLLLSDSSVAPLYLAGVKQALLDARPELLIGELVLPAGEASKTLANFGAAITALASLGATRDACVMALGGGVAGDDAALAQAIARSCEHKAEIVARDPLERGERALLNLGHTFGHAIETEQGYGAPGNDNLNHGEAVAVGMVLAARLSAQLGMSHEDDTTRLRELLLRYELPVAIPAGLAPEALLARMRLDKKNVAGRLRLVLWRGIGRAEVVADVDEADVLRVLATG